jgi:hypothetical protein
MRKLSTAVLACCLTLAATRAFADVTLVLFRHAEKPAAGLGQLSCQGLNRALALPRVLLANFGRPAAIYAPNPGVTKEDEGVAFNYLRPLATVEPTAIRAGLPVDTSLAWNDIAHLQAELQRPQHAGQTLFVAWEHHELEQLARNLLDQNGGDRKQVPKWDGSDFDSIYVVTLRSGGGVAFKLAKEGLDKASPDCPGG